MSSIAPNTPPEYYLSNILLVRRAVFMTGRNRVEIVKCKYTQNELFLL